MKIHIYLLGCSIVIDDNRCHATSLNAKQWLVHLPRDDEWKPTKGEENQKQYTAPYPPAYVKQTMETGDHCYGNLSYMAQTP